MVPNLYARSIRLSQLRRPVQQKPPPRWLEANVQVKKDVRREAPGRRRPYLGLLLLPESDGRACFVGGTEREQTAGSVTLASPPSRRFSTRPHCVLLPLRLSLTPAPTSSVPDCCSGFFFFFTFIYYLFLLHAENDSDLHTAEHITF